MLAVRQSIDWPHIYRFCRILLRGVVAERSLMIVSAGDRRCVLGQGRLLFYLESAKEEMAGLRIGYRLETSIMALAGVGIVSVYPLLLLLLKMWQSFQAGQPHPRTGRDTHNSGVRCPAHAARTISDKLVDREHTRPSVTQPVSQQ